MTTHPDTPELVMLTSYHQHHIILTDLTIHPPTDNPIKCRKQQGIAVDGGKEKQLQFYVLQP